MFFENDEVLEAWGCEDIRGAQISFTLKGLRAETCNFLKSPGPETLTCKASRLS